MSSIIVRGLDHSIKQRLATQAKEHGRSMEAEVRDILVARESTEHPISTAEQPTHRSRRSVSRMEPPARSGTSTSRGPGSSCWIRGTLRYERAVLRRRRPAWTGPGPSTSPAGVDEGPRSATSTAVSRSGAERAELSRRGVLPDYEISGCSPIV